MTKDKKWRELSETVIPSIFYKIHIVVGIPICYDFSK